MANRKIVVEEQETGTLIGISRDGVDPFVKKMDLPFDKVLETAPFLGGVLAVAEQQWAVNPKNPPYVPPKAAPGVSTPKPSVKKTETKKTEAKSAGKKKTPKTAPTPPAVPGVNAAPAETRPEQPPVAPVLANPDKPLTDVKAEDGTTHPAPRPEADFKAVPETKAPLAETITPPVETKAPANEPVVPETKAPTADKPGPRVCDTEHLRDYPGCMEECEHDVCTGGIESVKQVSASVAQKPTRVSADSFQYKLKDGRGPYANIQLALDAMGADKVNRPLHNRYDRLSKKLQAEIIQEKKP